MNQAKRLQFIDKMLEDTYLEYLSEHMVHILEAKSHNLKHMFCFLSKKRHKFPYNYNL